MLEVHVSVCWETGQGVKVLQWSRNVKSHKDPNFIVCLNNKHMLEIVGETVFLTFYWYLYWSIVDNNGVFIAGVQQRDSVMHICVSIFFQILFPFMLLHNIEQNYLCYTVGPSWLSISNIAVCTFSQIPLLSAPLPLPSGNKFLF